MSLHPVELTGIEVAPATWDDLPQLTALFQDYRAHFSYTGGALSLEAYVRRIVEGAETDALVARRSGAVIGFVTVCRSLSSVYLSPALNVVDLWVVPHARGSSTADLLIDGVQQYAEEIGAASVFFVVPADRRDLVRYYRRKGWAVMPLLFLRRLVGSLSAAPE